MGGDGGAGGHRFRHGIADLSALEGAGGGKCSPECHARLSNLMGIHKALMTIFQEPERAYSWIRMDNAAFDGVSALRVMLGGQLTDIMRVRCYLEAECAGG